MSQCNDTTPAAAKVWADVFRAMPVSRKWRLLEETFETARTLHAAGMRLHHPQATAVAIHRDWMKRHFGLDLSGEGIMTPSGGRLDVLREVLDVFRRLDIPHALGGSMASSLHGIARFTLDADVTVEPFPGKEAALTRSFGPDYYLSLPAVEEAVRQRASFNIIHIREGFKVDVFVRKDTAFEKTALERRVFITMPDVPDQPIAVLAPEDVILFKLQWYRLGQEVARQQLDDVRGILQSKAGQLDEEYLARWAASLNVLDLLRRVRDELA
jgi:hypothetical protein